MKHRQIAVAAAKKLKEEKQIDLALFGAGRWGSHLLRNFLTHPQIRLRAVGEAAEERLAALK